jgi:hypothetical protein
MGDFLNGRASGMATAIGAEQSAQLTRIQGLIAEGQILPQFNLRLLPGSPQPARCFRPLRVGVLPTAGNPLHWMHLIGGLEAMAICRLDKVIYVIAGNDPRKPNLPRSVIRHRIGRNILGVFRPLFACTPISLHSAADGETNLFRILQMNSGRAIEAFYISGTDHYNRYNPRTGEPDTIQKLEDGVRQRIFGYDERRNPISAIFVNRGEPAADSIETFLNTGFIRRTPFNASSTSIREALEGRGLLEDLATLPYSVFQNIRKSTLYPRSVAALPAHQSAAEPCARGDRWLSDWGEAGLAATPELSPG